MEELTALRQSVLEHRYDDALAIVGDLEDMGRKSILRNIASFLKILLIHLIKNQIEQRLTNAWVASISNAILEIQDLNLQNNRQSYYLAKEDWQELLEETLEKSIRLASLEIWDGRMRSPELKAKLNRDQLFKHTQQLLHLTYQYSPKVLPDKIDEYLQQLPGAVQYFES
jgi:hypothetical protein